MKNQRLLQGIHYVMNAPQLEKPLTYALSKASKVDRQILESKHALRMPITTLDVFADTMDEIFQTEYQYAGAPFKIPCYFGMSINDDILNYDGRRNCTFTFSKSHHSKIHPSLSHQPPKPPTFEWLNSEFGQFLDVIE